jgi:hypothetical protein
MKKALIGVMAAVFASAVYATCTTHTYFGNGKIITCTTCCYGNSCTTNCF